MGWGRERTEESRLVVLVLQDRSKGGSAGAGSAGAEGGPRGSAGERTEGPFFFPIAKDGTMISTLSSR